MDERSPRPAGRWNRVAVVVVVVAMVGVVVALVAGAGGDSDPEGSGIDPKKALAVRYEQFEGGRTSLAEAYEGRPLVVNFFGSWCAPCVQEMPAIEKVHQKYKDQVAFVGLDVQDTLEQGRKIVRKTGVTYDLGRDPAGDLLKAFGGDIMPTTVLVGADGDVVELHNGEISQGNLEELVQSELLADDEDGDGA